MMDGKDTKKEMAMGGMPMAKKGGKKVPAFAADGIGKMAKGGMAAKKGYAKGGMVKANCGASMKPAQKSGKR
jgi:hypothetical protein